MQITWPFSAGRKNLAKKSPEATPAGPLPRPGFFSTDIAQSAPNRNEQAMAMRRRQQEAIGRSIQKGIESMVAVDSAGQPVEGDGHALDHAYPDLTAAKMINSTGAYLPIQQLEWFAGQGFVGWQTCAILSQNWLIDKACRMPGDDAIRHGWDITSGDGEALEVEDIGRLRKVDKAMMIKKQCREFIKFGRVFGIRHALFLVDGIDYELPFNPDGVTPGSYKGISQIDPYWVSPILDRSAAANPAAKDFYEPTWWQVNGKRVHKSHFVIMRNGGDVADILKPSYFYSGIPVTQKIYERVYSAERTANEAPMLAMSKRLTCLQLDLSQAGADPEKLQSEMALWSALMNNFGIKVIGDGENIQQFDTNLTGLDETIMTQYQIVAAAAEVPATKLLGTTPKGFNSTGEAEESSYHEMLESLQEHELTPLLDRHYLLTMRSYMPGKETNGILIAWKPVDSPTAKEMAETNKLKADTDSVLVNCGAIDGFDVRQRLIADENSGYHGIEEVVPDGPGDREAEIENKSALMEEAAQPKIGNPKVGVDE